tara:strand:- start:96 stop:257 length:162 start_codon:yes stop_codon:yes gene_type:complete
VVIPPTLPAVVQTDDGVFVHKNENGQKESEIIWKDGKVVSETRWDKEGNEINK